jgi:hypothetical protein
VVRKQDDIFQVYPKIWNRKTKIGVSDSQALDLSIYLERLCFGSTY